MIAAADAQDRVDQLVVLTGRLTGLLTTEADAYEARRPHEVAGGAEETARLANIYRHEAARLKAEPELIKGARADSHKKLIQATEVFEAVLTRHGRAIAAAKAVTEGLVHAIAEEVAATRAASTPYGADARTGETDASAITLNKRA
ncbi:MAG TPA: flagellar basal body protein [Caulobacteraceae bacterium]|jgi:hypothetical protein|nr:flagellar basal body protein [Caulobacteraceae bacterium]